MTGYDLTRRIADEVEPVWKSRFSEIYPALARLRRAGHVALRVLGPRRGPRRNLYRTTAAGRRELRRFLTETVVPLPGRDEGLLRIALLGSLDPPSRHRVLWLYEQGLSEEILRLSQGPPPEGYIGEARRGAVARLEATLRWVRGLSQRRKTAEAPRAARGASTGRKR
jgi:DNA-binding PadR family transcriptional regulator